MDLANWIIPASIWISIVILVSSNSVHIDNGTSDIGHKLSKRIPEAAHIVGVSANDDLHPLIFTQ